MGGFQKEAVCVEGGGRLAGVEAEGEGMEAEGGGMAAGGRVGE